MRKLGISIYPEKSSYEELTAYIDLASKNGFTRIFSCLLSAEEEKDTIVEEYSTINQYAHDKGFEIILDVSPRVFSKLDISYSNLQFFKQLGADGIRLDVGFSGNEEALMTYNPEKLSIEINMSNNVHTIDTIMDYQPNRFNLLGCHNFYPHNYTGLGLDFFKKTSERFSKYGLRTAAFVTSQNAETFGPWPVTDGLPTLEMHRHLPLDIQVKHLIALDSVDDILISNCYPTDAEIKRLGHLDLSTVTFAVEPVENLPDIEYAILFETLHVNRGDISENVIRSTQSRVKYKGHQFDIFNAPEYIFPGDVIIESSEYGHYAGELQIALAKMKNSGKSNVVGKINKDEIFILSEIKPWQKFRLSISKN